MPIIFTPRSSRHPHSPFVITGPDLQHISFLGDGLRLLSMLHRLTLGCLPSVATVLGAFRVLQTP